MNRQWDPPGRSLGRLASIDRSSHARPSSKCCWRISAKVWLEFPGVSVGWVRPAKLAAPNAGGVPVVSTWLRFLSHCSRFMIFSCCELPLLVISACVRLPGSRSDWLGDVRCRIHVFGKNPDFLRVPTMPRWDQELERYARLQHFAAVSSRRQRRNHANRLRKRLAAVRFPAIVR